jgi:TolA-binding protein
MSNIDALVKEAEGRIAKSGRSALGRARAEERLSRLVEATAASAARSTQTSSWRWIASAGGAAVLAGAVLTAVFTRTPPPSSSSSSTPAQVVPIAMQEVSSPTRAGVPVERLPNAPEQPAVTLPAPRASAHTHVVAVASNVRIEPSAKAISAPASSASEIPASENAEPTTESASALFERANSARRGGDYGPAEELYRRVLDSYPGSREAATSRIVLGRMLLSRSDAGAALALFDRYLAESPNGSLAEQALVGRAQCLKLLHRREDERAAWRLLLDRFPGSPNRTEALERLR